MCDNPGQVVSGANALLAALTPPHTTPPPLSPCLPQTNPLSLHLGHWACYILVVHNVIQEKPPWGKGGGAGAVTVGNALLRTPLAQDLIVQKHNF